MRTLPHAFDRFSSETRLPEYKHPRNGLVPTGSGLRGCRLRTRVYNGYIKWGFDYGMMFSVSRRRSALLFAAAALLVSLVIAAAPAPADAAGRDPAPRGQASIDALASRLPQVA